jgi:hypothetical protein
MISKIGKFVLKILPLILVQHALPRGPVTPLMTTETSQVVYCEYVLPHLGEIWQMAKKVITIKKKINVRHVEKNFLYGII